MQGPAASRTSHLVSFEEKPGVVAAAVIDQAQLVSRSTSQAVSLEPGRSPEYKALEDIASMSKRFSAGFKARWRDVKQKGVVDAC